ERSIETFPVPQDETPYVDLEERFADRAIATSVDGAFCANRRILPLHRLPDRLIVAMVDPTDGATIDTLVRRARTTVMPVHVSVDAFLRTLRAFHGAPWDARPDAGTFI